MPAGYKTASLEIRDLVTGRTLEHYAIGQGSTELQVPTQSYTAGCYTYTLVVDGAAIATQKMVVLK